MIHVPPTYGCQAAVVGDLVLLNSLLSCLLHCREASHVIGCLSREHRLR